MNYFGLGFDAMPVTQSGETLYASLSCDDSTIDITKWKDRWYVEALAFGLPIACGSSHSLESAIECMLRHVTSFPSVFMARVIRVIEAYEPY